MDELLSNKIREQFSAMAIYKDPTSTGSLLLAEICPHSSKTFCSKDISTLTAASIVKNSLLSLI